MITLTNLSYRPARTDELPVVIGIYEEAARWMAARGIVQWDYPAPRDLCDFTAEQIAAGGVHLALLDRAIGTFRLDWTGAPLWPEEADAGYVYTLAIRPAYMGQGVGAAILQHAIGQIRANGKTLVRLDCISANQRLRRYYQDLGFQYRGEGVFRHYQLALFERSTNL